MSDFENFEMDITDLFVLSKLRNSSFDQIVVSIGKEKLTLKEYKELLEIKTRLKDGYPLAYILGQIEFGGRSFALSPAVLVPRPETEEWLLGAIEKIQSILQSQTRLNIIELATGSGVIGLTLWLRLSQYIDTLILSDIQGSVLAIAQQNFQDLATNFSSSSKPKLILSDLFQAFEVADLAPFKTKSNTKSANTINIFMANLPYLPDSDQIDLPMLAHEPSLALFSGESGLDLFQKCLVQIENLELCFDSLYFELDPRNIFAASQILSKKLYFKQYEISIFKDFLGQNRVLNLTYCTKTSITDS